MAYEPRPRRGGLLDRTLVRRAIERAVRRTLANLDRCFGESHVAPGPGAGSVMSCARDGGRAPSPSVTRKQAPC